MIHEVVLYEKQGLLGIITINRLETKSPPGITYPHFLVGTHVRAVEDIGDRTIGSVSLSRGS